MTPLLLDQGGDAPLAPDGVDGTRRPLNVQEARQVGNRHDLVGLLLHLQLSEHQSLVREPCADHVDRLPARGVVEASAH